MEPIRPAPEIWLVLVMPRFSVSTAWAYRVWGPEECLGASLAEFLSAMRSGSPGAIAAALRNDLEPGVSSAHGEIAAIRAQLLELGALGARMTGSGSAVFGVAADEAAACRIASGLGEGDVFVLRTQADARPAVF